MYDQFKFSELSVLVILEDDGWYLVDDTACGLPMIYDVPFHPQRSTSIRRSCMPILDAGI